MEKQGARKQTLGNLIQELQEHSIPKEPDLKTDRERALVDLAVFAFCWRPGEVLELRDHEHAGMVPSDPLMRAPKASLMEQMVAEIVDQHASLPYYGSTRFQAEANARHRIHLEMLTSYAYLMGRAMYESSGGDDRYVSPCHLRELLDLMQEPKSR